MTNPESTVSPLPPRSRRKRRWAQLAAFVLLIAGLGRAAWPVIDVSAVAQLIEAVQLAQNQLEQATIAKQALLGEVAALTAQWNDLVGAPFELGQDVGGAAAEIAAWSQELDQAWPTEDAIRGAYADQDSEVVQQVLEAHRAATRSWQAERGAWSDAQVSIASAGQFLAAVETAAAAQNGTTDQGLSAQLDRQIAVSSSARDIAAKTLEVAVAGARRAARLEHLQAVEQADRRRRALEIRAEIQDVLVERQTDFDAAAFDRTLYAPVLPSYGATP